jgi:hypothetical protein
MLTPNTQDQEPKCGNPSFGLATKAKGLQGCGPRGSPGNQGKEIAKGQEEAFKSRQRGRKGAGQEEAQESHHIFPGM